MTISSIHRTTSASLRELVADAVEVDLHVLLPLRQSSCDDPALLLGPGGDRVRQARWPGTHPCPLPYQHPVTRWLDFEGPRRGDAFGANDVPHPTPALFDFDDFAFRLPGAHGRVLVAAAKPGPY